MFNTVCSELFQRCKTTKFLAVDVLGYICHNVYNNNNKCNKYNYNMSCYICHMYVLGYIMS